MAESIIITGDDAKEKCVEDLFTRLDSSPKGLSSTEVARRLAQYARMPWKKKRLTPS